MVVMKYFTIMVTTFALSISSAGCSKSSSSSSSTGSSDSDGVSSLKKIKNEACACKDRTCSLAVQAKIEALGERLDKGVQPSKADGDAMGELTVAAMICMRPHLGIPGDIKAE
jgi:hypothetical protein